MKRNEKRKLLKALVDLQGALKQSLEVTESAVSIAAETKALLDKSAALAEQWRGLYEAAQNRPVVVEIVLVPSTEWAN
jgi:hypothetical protein